MSRRRRALRLLVLLAILAPLTAVADGTRHWEIWRDFEWLRLQPPYSTDGGRPAISRDGTITCNGVLRRYVMRERRKHGGQCVVTTAYSYYCRPVPGLRVVVSAAQAPACGPTVACE
jgi:hypothetical protein